VILKRYSRELYLKNRSRIIKKNALNNGAFHSWSGMRQRCTNSNQKSYAGVGAKGIRVCKRWRNSFENFLADMGPRPSRQHYIGRLDWKQDYKPNNCCWMTMKQIQQGRPCSPLSDSEMPFILRMRSEGMTQLEIGQKYGITQSAVSQAIKRYSESLPSTVVDTEPTKKKKKV
jgi:uncharacterized protein (DUF433 family)